MGTKSGNWACERPERECFNLLNFLLQTPEFLFYEFTKDKNHRNTRAGNGVTGNDSLADRGGDEYFSPEYEPR